MGVHGDADDPEGSVTPQHLCQRLADETDIRENHQIERRFDRAGSEVHLRIGMHRPSRSRSPIAQTIDNMMAKRSHSYV
jgi:hypothetical protein